MWDTWWCNLCVKYQGFSVSFCVICSLPITSNVTLKGNSFIQIFVLQFRFPRHILLTPLSKNTIQSSGNTVNIYSRKCSAQICHSHHNSHHNNLIWALQAEVQQKAGKRENDSVCSKPIYITQLYLECVSAAVFFGNNERRTRDGCCLINVSSETRKGMIAPWRMRSARGVDFSVTRSSSPRMNRINNSESSRLWITLLMLSQGFYHSRPPLFRSIFVLSLLQESKNCSLT